MADKSKDTGTGGINIEDKVVTMDVGVPDAQVDNSKPWSAGDISVDKTVKDISKPTRETFAKYLSKATLGVVGSAPHKNQYPVGNGESTTSQEISLKDENGNPISPGQQNNENKFDAGFNQTIASNNPAGIRKGLATGSGPDGNELLPAAVVADELQEPIKTYTSNVISSNLYDYDSTRVAITDGTLNQPPDAVREIKVVPSKASVATDGGTSNNILSDEPDYVLTDEDARAQAGLRTAQNFFPVEFATELVKPWDVNNKPISVTAAQNNITNINFFTKIVKIQGEGENQSQVVSALQLPTYTEAYQEAVTEGFEIKRGQTAAGEKAVDGNRLLTGIAPLNEQKKATLTTGAQAYLTNVVSPNIYNDGSAKVEIPEYENDSAPSGVRVLNVTTTFAADGGTSKNIANQSRRLTLAQAATIVQNKTAGNAYPVDTPTAGSGTSISITPVKISATDKLAKTANTNYFADLSIGSNPVISKGKLKNKDSSNNNLPDGNTLLPNASTQASAGLSYIKFVTSNDTGTVGLNTPIKGYTGGVVNLNLFNYNSSLITLSDGALGVAPLGARENLKYIPSDASITVDGGTSANILGSDDALVLPDYTLSLEDRATFASVATSGNFFKVDAPEVKDINGVKTVTTKKIVSTTPLSATDSQDSPFNSFYFTKALKESNVPNTPPIVVNNLKSTYTDALKEVAKATDDKDRFIIKRGKTEKTGGIDGNNLLPLIAPEANGTAVLTTNAQSYFNQVIKPNRHTYSAAPVDLEQALNLDRDLKYIPLDASIKSDGGVSKNILGPDDAVNLPDYTLTFEDLATKASTVTVNNFFKIDAPEVKDIGGVKTVTTQKTVDADGNPNSVTTSQDKPLNQSFFSKLPSSYTQVYAAATADQAANVKFEIKRGKVAAGLGAPNGNELLQTIASESNGKVTLSPGAGTYMLQLLKPNLNKATNVDVVPLVTISEGGENQTATEKPIHVTYGLAEDGMKVGSSKVLSETDESRTLTLLERAKKATQVTNGSYGAEKHSFGPKDQIQATSIPNVYPIGLPSTDATGNLITFKILDEGGYPVSPSNAQAYPKHDSYFTKSSKIKLNSSYSDDLTAAVNFQILRGKSQSYQLDPGSPPAVDGHKLLPEAAEPTSSTEQVFIKTTQLTNGISSYVTEVLKKNRFNPVENDAANIPKKFTGNDDTTEALLNPLTKLESAVGMGNSTFSDGRPEDARSIFNRNASFAKPSALRMGSSNIANNGSALNRSEYNFQRLSKIGTVLQLMATGEIQALANQSLDPRNPLTEFAALAPGLGQLGAGVPFPSTLLDTNQIIEVLNDTGDNDPGSINTRIFGGQLIDFNRQYEAVINSSLEKFSGFSALGMLVLAAVLVIVIMVAYDFILGAAISATLPSQRKNSDLPNERSGLRSMGSFHGRGLSASSTNIVADILAATSDPIAGPGAFFASLFGIMPTFNRTYYEAISIGAKTFFGLGKAPPPGLSYPGALVVTARATVRSATRIVLAFQDLIELMGSANFFSGILQIVEIIDIIRNSRLIRSANMLAQLGDKKVRSNLPSEFSTSPIKYPADTVAGEDPSGTGQVKSIQEEDSLFTSILPFEVQDDNFDIGKKISEIDCADDASSVREELESNSVTRWKSTAHIKSRMKSPSKTQISPKLSWATYRTPSMLLVPFKKFTDQKIDNNLSTNLMTLPGAPPKSPKFDGENSLVVYDEGTTRISTEVVHKLENILDGEHVPFYMQDLRTNEILSFHAFLLSLSDDYTANYESFEGIGRIEPIKSYKNTQRKIGISFIIAALDENDFNHMWEKINKLTTLVYPQYTAGKEYSNPGRGYQFEKPFTQMIAASPMIRLRLGNLFRSNYSRFNLAGIFGLHDLDNVKIATAIDKEKDPRRVQARAKAADAGAAAAATFDNDKTNKYKNDYLFKASEGLYFNHPPPGYDPEGKKNTAEQDKKLKEQQKTEQDKAAKAVKNAKGSKKGEIKHYQPAKAANADGKGKPKQDQKPGDWYLVYAMPQGWYFKIIQATSDQIAAGFVVCAAEYIGNPPVDDKILFVPEAAGNNKWFVSISALSSMSEETSKKYNAARTTAINKEVETVQGQQANANKPLEEADETARKGGIQGFMKPENNAIVRSFESAGGKGLAGFIDSISFDWYSGVTWDITDVAKQVPKMCKVTLSFTPVHDISPGLDKFGHNRAPIYPVGLHSHGIRRSS